MLQSLHLRCDDGGRVVQHCGEALSPHRGARQRLCLAFDEQDVVLILQHEIAFACVSRLAFVVFQAFYCGLQSEKA